MRVHRLHDFVGGVRPGHRQHLGMCLTHDVALGAQAAGDDHLAVLRQCLAYGLERLLHRRIDEAAGVDHHQVGSLVGGRNGITLGAQLRQDALRIDQRLGAAERDESDFGQNRGQTTFFLQARGDQEKFGEKRGLSPVYSSSFFFGAGCPGKPGKGKPAKIFLVWLFSWSCICMNTFLLWSM